MTLEGVRAPAGVVGRPAAFEARGGRQLTALGTASAHMSERFGIDYGVLIEENRLLGRAVFVIDRDGVVRHAEYVRLLTQEPDYERALEAARQAAG